MTAPFHDIHSQGLVRVASCTPRVEVANPTLNGQHTLELARRGHEQHVDLMLFPELGLSAYAIDDLLLRGAAVAKANGRDIIERHDLPRIELLDATHGALGAGAHLAGLVDQAQQMAASAQQYQAQALASQIIADYDDPELGRFRGPGINARLSATPGSVRRPRPRRPVTRCRRRRPKSRPARRPGRAPRQSPGPPPSHVERTCTPWGKVQGFDAPAPLRTLDARGYSRQELEMRYGSLTASWKPQRPSLT